MKVGGLGKHPKDVVRINPVGEVLDNVVTDLDGSSGRTLHPRAFRLISRAEMGLGGRHHLQVEDLALQVFLPRPAGGQIKAGPGGIDGKGQNDMKGSSLALHFVFEGGPGRRAQAQPEQREGHSPLQIDTHVLFRLPHISELL